jgi:flagellar biosynthesis/type III secretory pathway protein FliH
MRHEQTVRFVQSLRAVRLTETSAGQSADSQSTADPQTRALAEIAAAKELEQREGGAIAVALAGLAEAAGSLTSSRNELLSEMQQAAVELATAISMRVTYDKLQTDRFAIEELVHAVVGRLGSTGPVQVRMHPDDLALLERRLGEGRSVEHDAIHLTPDDTLGRGDCVADAGDVSFASYLEEQLSGIRQHLLRKLSDARFECRKAAAGDRELRRIPDRRQTA